MSLFFSPAAICHDNHSPQIRSRFSGSPTEPSFSFPPSLTQQNNPLPCLTPPSIQTPFALPGPESGFSTFGRAVYQPECRPELEVGLPPPNTPQALTSGVKTLPSDSRSKSIPRTPLFFFSPVVTMMVPHIRLSHFLPSPPQSVWCRAGFFLLPLSTL